MSRPTRPLASAAAFTFATAAILWAFLYLAWSPDRWPPTERPPKQAEAVDLEKFGEGKLVHSAVALARVVREPQNSWSNLAFVFAGVWLACRFPRRLTKSVGVSLVGVGIGSFLYHASASPVLRAVDVGAMYWNYGLIALLALNELSPRRTSILETCAYVIAFGLLILCIVTTPWRGLTIAGIRPFDIQLDTEVLVVVVGAALIVRAVREPGWGIVGMILGSLILFGTAAACQIGDRTGGWCWNPNALIQGHAAWHCLSAAGGCLAIATLSRKADASPAT